MTISEAELALLNEKVAYFDLHFNKIDEFGNKISCSIADFDEKLSVAGFIQQTKDMTSRCGSYFLYLYNEKKQMLSSYQIIKEDGEPI